MGRPKGEGSMRHTAQLFIVMFTFILVIGAAAPALSASWSGGLTKPLLQAGTPRRLNSETNWEASIMASFASGSDDAIFGVRPDATDGFDSAYDIPEPPSPPNPPYIRAYFYYSANPDVKNLHKSCIAPASTLVWDNLRIEYNSVESTDVTLSWDVSAIPSDYTVCLYKYTSPSSVVFAANMKTSSSYTYTAAPGTTVFKIVLTPPLLAWTQMEWSGGPTTPGLDVGTWDTSYNKFYDGGSVDSSTGNVTLSSGASSGWFESSIYDATSIADWGVVTWNALTPSFAGSDTYAYVSSYTEVKGTVTNFTNQQAEDGAYATLAERQVTNVLLNPSFETWTSGKPDSWTGPESGATIAQEITIVKDGSSSVRINTTGTTNAGIYQIVPVTVGVSYTFTAWLQSPGTGTTGMGIYIGWRNAADGSISTTSPVYNTTASTWQLITTGSVVAPALAVTARAQIRGYRDTASPTGYADNATFGKTTGTSCDMEINESIASVPSADTQTLELRYKLANTVDSFNVKVLTGSTWNTRGATLSSTSWTDWSYTLLSSEVVGGTVQVKFVDVDPSSASPDNILIDYLRVKSYSAPWSTSLVLKARTNTTVDDDNPYDGDWSDWYEQTNGAESAMENGRYVQYRVELSSTDTSHTPVLLSGSVVINYTVDTTPPEVPSLVSPANGAETFDNTPTFEWTSVTDPSGVTYQIEIDVNDDFSSPVYYAIDLTETTHTLPDANALALGKYFWHVQAKDGVGNIGDWSETWNFNVVPIGAVGVLLMSLLMLLPFALMLRRQNRRYRY